MSMQILSIVLYNHKGEQRSIQFKPGRVNIITGQSTTGKSAIIEIIDYCLGSSHFRIPEGVIRETVSWYGLLLQIRDGTQVFIAKPSPEPTALSQSSAYYEIGATLTPPDFSTLTINSNDDEIVASLSQLIGIVPNNSSLEDEKTKNSIESTIRHTTFYLYQDQSLIANKEVLFHRQVEDFMPKTIRETLPFFLGIYDEKRIKIEHELRLARKVLKSAQRDLEEAEAVLSDRMTRGMSLVAEAKQVGLLSEGINIKEINEMLSVLREISNWKPTNRIEENDQAPILRNKIGELRNSMKRKKAEIDSAESFVSFSQSYSNEVNEQLMRLQPIGLFDQISDNKTCPICNSKLESPPPTVEAVKNSVNKLNESLSTVQKERPRLQGYIDTLKKEYEDIRRQVVENEIALDAVVVEQTAADEIRDNNTRIARVEGRISLYLDTIEFVDNRSKFTKAVKDAQQKFDKLDAELTKMNTESEDNYISMTNRISSLMTKFARTLNIEHSESPFRLDLRHLTVAIDRPGRPIHMQRIGSGRNWLGCHLSSLLALHQVFIENNSPVPRFIVLDQPSQVYFVSPQTYLSLNGSLDDTQRSRDTDLQAVQQMFNVLFSFCESFSPKFQVIILEHANLPDQRFQNALVTPPWNSGLALIPSNWL